MAKIRKHKIKKNPGTATKSLNSISLNKKKQKQFSKKTKLSKKIRKDTPTSNLSNGVIRLTNIPHGFYEEPMQRYFGQFGKVMDIKVARSRKSAKPLGLAYVKFQYRGVARLVATSMNGYLMFNKIMRCKYIKSAKVSEIMMFGNKFTKAESCPGVLKHRFKVDEFNGNRTPNEDIKRQSRLAEKMMKKEKMMKDMGLNINLNVPEDKIFIKKKKSSDSSTIKEEHLTPEESKKFEEAKDELADTIKAKLEEQKENSPEDEEDSDTENEEDSEAKTIMEVDESEDEIVIKTPPNAIKKTKRKSHIETPKSLVKKGKLEIDPCAPTPKMKTPKPKTPKPKTPKPKNADTNTPKVSKLNKKFNQEILAENLVKDNEKTPLSNKKSISRNKAATPGLTTPKSKKNLKIPQSS